MVLHINAKKAKNWDTREVITRWHKLFNGTPLTHRYLANSLKYQVERDAVETLAETWREQLISISWYMRVLNEGIAREANNEDQCTGRFFMETLPGFHRYAAATRCAKKRIESAKAG